MIFFIKKKCFHTSIANYIIRGGNLFMNYSLFENIKHIDEEVNEH